jgi:outer membrane protein TolC
MAAEALIKAGKHGVKIAEEQYNPGFNVGLNYGLREGNLPDGDNRPDFVTAKVSFDVPLFTGKRQDRQLSASRYQAASAQYKRDDILRNLKAMLETDYSNWKRYDERARHYEASVLKQAKENFEASLRAYQEDRTDFSSLIRAQVMELDTELKSIKLKTDKAKAHSRLLYLQGDKS